MTQFSTQSWHQWLCHYVAPETLVNTANPLLTGCGVMQCSDGRRFLIKLYQGQNAARRCASEVEGLNALFNACKQLADHHLHAFQPLAYGLNWLALPFVNDAHNTRNWTALGRGLASLHSQHQPQFGFTCDNFCGPTPQPNPLTSNGYLFFAQQRLQHQARLNAQKSQITVADAAQIDRLCTRLKDLLPHQAPALLHGDLWSGNVLFSVRGEPVLIDPACYFGWPEADLAMTLLFGGFDAQFYHAYEEVRPLTPGWRQQAEIYNLYHLLNHLFLFGNSYYGQVKAVLNRYCD